MPLRRHRLALTPILLPFLLLACTAAPSATPRPTAAVAAGSATALPYLTPQQFDFRAILPPPPADNSPAHSQEVARMLALQDSRTPQDVLRCRSEEEVSAFSFDTVLGPGFNADNLPTTAALMHEAYSEAKAVSGAAKKIWNRQRPPLADPRIHPCVVLEKSSSYPSGHAVRGIVWATLLAEIFPHQRDALMARGRQIGDDRFLAGMHYPSDVAAGQTLGAVIAQRLLANPAFRAQLDQAQTECRDHARGEHPKPLRTL